MKKNYWFIIVTVIYCSCSNETSDPITDLEVITMDSEFSNQPDFIRDTTLIPLEFCDDCIIGDITKVLKSEDGFVISDKRISGQVLKFSDKGDFQFKIGDKGDGLGNYVLPFDISLVPGTDKIAVLDQNQRKILFYSLANGSFIEELPINFQAKSLHFISEKRIAIHFDGQFSGNERDSLAGILDLEKEQFVFKGVLDFAKTDQNKTAGDFYISSEGLLFSKSLNDTIYEVFENEFVPKYFLDFSERAVSDEIKVLPLMDMRMRMMQAIPFYHNGNFIENANYLFFLWWGEDEFENFSVWDKRSKELLNFKGKDLFFKRPFFMDENYMYCFLMNEDYERMNSTEAFVGASLNQVIIRINLRE